MDNNDFRNITLFIHRCHCSNCQVMSTEKENLCCLEVPEVANKLSDVCNIMGSSIDCIVESTPFKDICLNPWVLQVSWLSFKQHYGKQSMTDTNEKYRHIAYRSFVRWCWEYCGRNNRKILPSCVVSCIRAHFPQAGDEDQHHYRGFQLPPLEWSPLVSYLQDQIESH